MSLVVQESFKRIGYIFRVFGISWFITIAAMLAILYFMGPQAALVAAILMVIEITFSFENAIINAKVVSTLSPFWQKMFLTIGILIAVIGMRVIFPIAVVALSANIPWGEVLSLAFNDPDAYSSALETAHPTIAAFGGMFLLVLALHFFLDDKRKVRWISFIEDPLLRLASGKKYLYVLISIFILLVLTVLPANSHPNETIAAGSLGILIYLVMHGLADAFGKSQNVHSVAKKAGFAGLVGFLYLEILDASFSFDGVIGAFAVTDDVILIAAGLGVGAIWVRSLTVHMVEKGTLQKYRYLEHGAHYTITVLALTLLAGLFFHVPELIAGIAGITFIGTAIANSINAKRVAHEFGGGKIGY